MKPLLALILFSIPLLAQEQQPLTAINGNCRVYFNLSVASSGAQATPWLPTQNQPPVGSAGTSLVIDNRQAGCYGWTVESHNHGFSALSLSFQSAPNNTGGTAPGTWSTVAVCGGTECLGVNPIVSTTDTVTTTKSPAAWFRVNLTTKTGTGSIEGVLYGYKVNIVQNGGSPSVACPGGANTDVQYNDSGSCGGTSGLTADPTRVYFANGAAATPSISFIDGQTGYYREASFIIATRDSANRWAASGVTTNVYQDNDSWRCGEGDTLGQRGACEIWSFRVSNNARFWDMTDTFLNWGDPAGGGAGNRVGVGRFSSEGATATSVHAAVQDGGAHVDMKALSFSSTGVAFASLGTPSSGQSIYCSDCTVTSSIDNTCAASGSGAMAERVNGAWKCIL